MKNKSLKNNIENSTREKVTRFSIRKVSFGAASVAVSALFMALGQGAASAAETNTATEANVTNAATDNNTTAQDNKKEEVAAPVATTTTPTTPTTAEKAADKINEKLATEANVAEKKEQTTSKAQEISNTTAETTKSAEVTAATTESNKPRSRKRRAAEPSSTTTDTTSDEAANQVYTAPRANAGLDELKEKLEQLPSAIQNNTKINNMDGVGATTGVEAGKVKEITEFGGWKAVNQADGSAGKFVVARATDKGVFPIETINTVGQNRTAWIGEQSVDRNSKYMLFLSEVRTQATRDKESYEGQPYKGKQDDVKGDIVAIGVKGYKGVEKTFKVYDTKTPGKVTVDFKTGFSGIAEGKSGVTVANYKVEVFSVINGVEKKVYTAEFDPKNASNPSDTEKTVVAAKKSTAGQSINVAGTTEENKAAALEALSKDNYKPYATGGRFTSKEIELPEGTTEYKVRISAANDRYLGMDYHSRFAQYALPLTGVDFNISQNTNVIAKDLLTKIYDKLKATVAKDEKGMTADSKAAYDAELEKVKTLVEAADLTTTDNYKTALTAVLQKQKELTVDKTALTAARGELDNLITTVSTDGKVENSITEYNKVKAEAQDVINEAKRVIDSDASTVEEVELAVAKVKQKTAELNAAKAALVDKATEPQKEALAKVDEELKAADTAGKTPESVDAYNKAVGKLQAELEEAKAKAKEVAGKGDNATKAEATEAQAKVAEVKAKLAEAAALLKDKANKDALEKAKAALDTLAKAEDPTAGKTEATKAAYAQAKADAEAAVTEATKVINNENATPEQVAAALVEANAKKAALEAAKAALVDKATEPQKEALAKVDEELKAADTAGKTPESVDAYNKAVGKLQAELEEAKAKAKEVAGKGDNATELEAFRAQAKVAEVKAKLAEAAALLKDKVNKDALEKAKAAVDTALAEKAKAIEANDKLSDAEKAAAKEEAKKAADEAKKAIAEAKDQAGVDAKVAEGKAAVEAVNPVGKEKAKAAVDTALAEKAKAIEANDKLSDAEKAAAKEEAKKAADEAKKAIAEAKDQAGVDAKVAEGKAAVAVNPVGKDKAKEEVEAELAKKLAELENATDLTDAEKAAAKAKVAEEAKKAIEAIGKAMTQAEVDQVIRNFVYRTSAVVLEKEEYDLSKLFVNGSVIVKQGEALADKDILSKLNLPEGVEVVKVEKPETVALGKGTAKVTLKLADGTQVTITVPVEVVEGSTTSGITKLSSEGVKTGETEESSNKVSNKQLPNTGTTETNTGLVGLGLGILGLLAAARRRKEK